MLKGKNFGSAIGEAIQRKLDAGSAKSKAEIARHFGMQPPLLSHKPPPGGFSSPPRAGFFAAVARARVGARKILGDAY